jgi:hypothetical protein
MGAVRPYDDRAADAGIAVRRGRLLAGFRGPLLGGGRAAVLSVAIDGVFGNAPPDARLHQLPLGGAGIRDLAVYRDGVLVLAGPAGHDPGRHTITGGMAAATT